MIYDLILSFGRLVSWFLLGNGLFIGRPLSGLIAMFEGTVDYLKSLFKDGVTDPIDKTLAIIPYLGDWLTKTNARTQTLEVFAEVLGTKLAERGLKHMVMYLVSDPEWQNYVCYALGGAGLLASPALGGRYGTEAAMLGTMTLVDTYMKQTYGAQGAHAYWNAVKNGAPLEKLKSWFRGMKYGAQDYVTTPQIKPRHTPGGIVQKAGGYLKQMYQGMQALGAGSEGVGGVQRAGKVGYSGGGAGWVERQYAPMQVSVAGTMGPLLQQ